MLHLSRSDENAIRTTPITYSRPRTVARAYRMPTEVGRHEQTLASVNGTGKFDMYPGERKAMGNDQITLEWVDPKT